MLFTVMTFLGNVGNKLTNSNVAKTMVNLGKSAKTKLGKQINTLLEKLGFRKPKDRKEKIELLKEVGKQVEKEIDKLEEQGRNNEPEQEEQRAKIIRESNQGAIEYRILNVNGSKSITDILNEIKPIVFGLVVRNLKCKFNLLLTCQVIKNGDDSRLFQKHLKSPAKEVPFENWFENAYQETVKILMRQFVRLTIEESGLALHSIDYADAHLSKYVQEGGHSYRPLPDWLSTKHSIINIKNDDKFCFKWAVGLAANLEYFKGTKNLQRPSKELREKSEESDPSNIDFLEPVGITEFLEFEKNNPKYKLVVRKEDPQHNEFITKRLFFAKKTGVPSNLFWDGKDHFSVIPNLSGLLSKQLCGKHRGRLFICDGCDNAMKSEKALVNHKNFVWKTGQESIQTETRKQERLRS